MVWLFAGLLCGVYTAQLAVVMSPHVVLPLLVVALLSIAGRRWWFSAGLLFGACLFVASLVQWEEGVLDSVYAGDSLVASCRVIGPVRLRDDRASFVAECPDHRFVPARVRLNWRQPPATPRAGDRWQFEVRLRPPMSAGNPGSFNAARHAFTSGFGASGYIVSSSRTRLLAAVPGRFDRLRKSLGERLEQLDVSDGSRAVMFALILGDRSGLDASQWRRFAQSGTSHLVAISGLHIGLLAGWMMIVARGLLALVRFPRNHRVPAVLAGIAAAWFFTALSGAGIPAVRASVMLSVLGIALLARRLSAGLSALSTGGVLVLVLHPPSALSAGFVLSFAAVLLLIWLAAQQGTRSSGWTLLGALWRLQLALFACLLPVLLSLGQGISLLSPVANLVAVPVFSLVTVPLCLLGGAVPPLSGFAWALAASSIDLVEVLIERLNAAGTVGGTVWFGVPGLLLAALPAGFPGRRAVLLVPFLLLAGARHGSPADCFRAAFLDVGQGTAILVETRSHRLLYDTGPGIPGVGSAAESVIRPFFTATARRTLDGLIVSHADLDHAGGVSDLLGWLSPDWILAGEPLPETDSIPCISPMAWRWDGVLFEILHPAAPSTLTGNDLSCVLRVSVGQRSLLLSGDIERESERRLVSRGLYAADVVSMPHHGSRTSSTTQFIRSVTPELAVVSAARFNRFDLPDRRVVDRWRQHGTRIEQTGRSGMLEVTLCGDEQPLEYRTWRQPASARAGHSLR